MFDFDVSGHSDVDEASLFDNDRQEIELRTSAHGSPAGGDLLGFVSDSVWGWGSMTVATVRFDVVTAGWLELIDITQWQAQVDGGFSALIEVDVMEGGRAVDTYVLDEIGDGVWLEPSGSFEVRVSMDWNHGWPEGSSGVVDLGFIAVPSPATFVLPMAVIGLLSGRRRGRRFSG